MWTGSTQEDFALLADQIRQLREALGATNDSDLAGKLGLTRFAISRWRARGVMPPEYRHLIERDPSEAVDYAVQFIAHHRLYAHSDHHYWLRAALQLLPSEYGAELTAARRALLLEFVLTRLMDAAADATTQSLGKARCESEGDFQALMGELESRFAGRIERVLADGLPRRTKESPQSAKTAAAQS